MKKTACVFACLCLLVITGIVVSGCSVKQKSQTINYQRRLQHYLPADSTGTKPTGTVDLSEGPKLKYDAKLGPTDLNFDIKIKNPY